MEGGGNSIIKRSDDAPPPFIPVATPLGGQECGCELMGVDMLLLNFQATMMLATGNVNRLTHRPNL
ncbi:hypothetical protein YC2023_093193 [Brassica napus]